MNARVQPFDLKLSFSWPGVSTILGGLESHFKKLYIILYAVCDYIL